ncbi:MAG: DUF3256 family protein [Pseudoflavonifractor sp.]|nr:DUF3256 family protein [Alloprevotella sp.]MCM1116759.1 DUF3256 family protein [Pseudoflavonifractor sp.]
MIHRIFRAIAIACFLVFSVTSATTIHAMTPTEAFVNIPDSIIPILDKSTRLDMVDYFHAGSDHSSRNNLYGNSRILDIKPDYIKVEMTGASTLQLVSLPVGSDTLTAVITTVMTPAPDSRLSLYRPDWSPLPLKAFKAPSMKQWLVKGADMKKIDNLLPLMLVQCDYNPESKSFIFTNTTPLYMSQEEYEPLSELLLSRLVYSFDPRKMQLKAEPVSASPNTAKP